MSFNQRDKLKSNIEAIRISLEWDGTTELSWGHKQKLKHYVGFGGIKGVLLSPEIDSDWGNASQVDKSMREDFRELHELLQSYLTDREYKNAVAGMRNGVLTQFYTPSEIPATFYRVLNSYTDIETMYDPCAGTGVFIEEAFEQLYDLVKVNAYEKDPVTGKVLNCIIKNTAVGCNKSVNIAGFEESPDTENGQYDLITSNIPYGAIPVYDKDIKDKNLTGKIHNYFFAKGLTKIKEGGLMGFLTTNAFLDTVSNKSAREYLFMHSDFISLTVMPDNLMKEIANTEAPSHFLVVRKRSDKTELSEEEKLLCVSENIQVQGVVVFRNRYIQEHQEVIIGEQKIGTNQYGKPTVEIRWSGEISGIAKPFELQLLRDFSARYTQAAITWKQSVKPFKGLNLDEHENTPIPNEMIWCKNVPVDIPDALDNNTPSWDLDDEYAKDLEHTCDNCGTIVWDLSEKMCPECTLEYNELTVPWKEQLDIEDYKLSSEDEEARLRDMADMEMGEGIYAEGSAAPAITIQLQDLPVPYKKDMLVEHEGNIVKLTSCSDTHGTGEIQEYKGKDQEKMSLYLKIRNSYMALEGAENQ